MQAAKASDVPEAPAPTRMEAKCIQGLAESRAGSQRLGRKLCQECVAGFAAQSDRLGLAEARLALAEVEIANGEFPAAGAQARQALEVIDPAGHKEAGWRGWALAAAAARRAGDNAHALEAVERAGQRLAELRAIWDAADFESYSQRPDLSTLLRELRDRKTAK